jgi:hypothetical protein
MSDRIGTPGQPIFGYVQNTGETPDTEDAINMAVNGSVTEASFVFTAQRSMHLERITMMCTDDAREIENGFFTIAAPGLTNGIQLAFRTLPKHGDFAELFGTGFAPIKRHADLGVLAGTDVQSDGTNNRSRFTIRWTIAKSGANYKMNAGDTFSAIVRDDLSGITLLRMMVQGHAI